MSKTFTREFKIEAVRLSYQTDKPLGELVENLGISRSSLSRWRREYGEDPDQAFPGKGQQKERDAEITQLKKELREAQLENEILKKAKRAVHRRHPSRIQNDEISIHRRAPQRVPDCDNVPRTRCFAKWILRLA